MDEQEILTLEARRQLIWAAKREGYLMAVSDLLGPVYRLKAALDDLLKILQQMEADQGDLAP